MNALDEYVNTLGRELTRHEKGHEGKFKAVFDPEWDFMYVAIKPPLARGEFISYESRVYRIIDTMSVSPGVDKYRLRDFGLLKDVKREA